MCWQNNETKKLAKNTEKMQKNKNRQIHDLSNSTVLIHFKRFWMKNTDLKISLSV